MGAVNWILGDGPDGTSRETGRQVSISDGVIQCQEQQASCSAEDDPRRLGVGVV